MRIVVGIDDCGHIFAIDVSTFEKLKLYCLWCAKEENEYGRHNDLIKRLENAQTEEELLSDENMDIFDDMEVSPFQGRFEELGDPLTWGK